jgi:predicted DCC family thiol-disulfide oxidoreductase YuxK
MSTKHEVVTISNVVVQKESEVVLFDSNCHTYADAVEMIELAIKCDLTTAVRYAEIAQMFGQVSVFRGIKEDCEKVASILSCTGLDVSVIS